MYPEPEAEAERTLHALMQLGHACMRREAREALISGRGDMAGVVVQVCECVLSKWRVAQSPSRSVINGARYQGDSE